MLPYRVPRPQRITPTPKSALPSLRLLVAPPPGALHQLALQFQLEQSQWWPAEHMEARQLEQIQAVLAHAAAHVPYYAERFAQAGIAIPDRIDAAFFRRIPISTRADLQAAGDKLFAKSLPAGHGKVAFKTTSGSTGRPLRIAQTQASDAIWRAHTVRDHLWHGRDFSGKLGAIRFVPSPTEALGPEGAQGANWGRAVSELYETGPAVLVSTQTPLPAQMAWLVREKPDVLISFPSCLTALARHAALTGVALPPLRELRTVGEKLTPETRAFLSQAWKAKVTDIYSCEEIGYLALQCPEHDHLHVQSECVRLEILDEAGEPCEPGRRGRVVVTSLANFAMPFIRYELGDIAEFGPPCPCGRGLPVLREVHGRTRSRLLLPDGTDKLPRLGELRIGETFGPSHGLRQMKCIQHSLTKLELMVVAEKSFTDTDRARLTQILLEHIGHPFEVELTFLPEIPRGPTGKLESFECRIQTGA